jgi:hypothetical protein
MKQLMIDSRIFVIHKNINRFEIKMIIYFVSSPTEETDGLDNEISFKTKK